MKKLLTLMLLFFTLSAHAVYVKPVVWYNTVGQSTYIPGDSRFFPTMEGACRHYYDTSYSQFPLLEQRNDLRAGVEYPGSCSITIRNSQGQSQMLGAPYSYAYQCPVGATLQSNSGKVLDKVCVLTSCPAGTTLDTATNTCIDNCAAKKGQSVEISVNGSNTNAPSAVCMPDSCAASLTGSAIGQKNGKYFGYAYGKYTGSACTSEPSSTNYTNPVQAPTPPADSPETDCIKQGLSFGTVNGAVTCVPKGTAGAPSVSDTDTTKTNTKNTDSKGQTTETEVTETKTTTKDGDEVKETTTTINPDGTKKEETKTQSYDEYCAQNPNNKLCKSDSDKESKFNGDCAANFVCEGDAIQCAIALKQHNTYCENTKNNTFSDIFNAKKSEADSLTANGGSVLPTSTIDIPSTIQGQKLLTSGGISDISFPVGGQSIVLPLSRLSPALEFCGQMVLIISYLISAYILFGHKGAQ